MHLAYLGIGVFSCLGERQLQQPRQHHADRKERKTNLRTQTDPLGKGREHANLHIGLLSDCFCDSRHAQSLSTTFATRPLLASSSELPQPSHIPRGALSSSHVYYHWKDGTATGIHV